MRQTRRQFLEITALGGGSLLATISLPGISRQAMAAAPASDGAPLGAFVRIHADNRIVIGARACEIGQGVRTSLPMLIAEELDVRWEQVHVEQLNYGIQAGAKPGSFANRYGDQFAGGSTNISIGWGDLRQAGAQIRALLIAAAARRWQVDSGSLTTRAGSVLHPDGRRATFGELAALAATLPLPAGPFKLKEPAEFRIIGRPTSTADGPDIVSGRARYGIDASVPAMLYAVIARCPWFDGRLKSLDDSAARKVRGVQAVVPIPPPPPGDLTRNLAAGVAVLANNTWAALQGRRALQIEWQPGPWAGDSTRALEQRCREAVASQERVQKGRDDGDLDAAWTHAATRVEADYLMPFLAHATMEPPGATLEIQRGRARLIASLQDPDGASSMVSAITGIPRLAIDVELPRAGGGFGRRLENDFVAEAAQIAQATGKSVKLLWTREDDLQNDFYRPFGVHRLRAALDADGKVIGWQHRVAATSRKWRAGRGDDPDWVGTLDLDAFPAGCVPNYRAEFVDVPFGLARGWWRGPLPTFIAFSNQSFVDEVAQAARRDPLELRLELLGAPRDLPYGGHGGPVLNTGRLAAALREAARRIDYARRRPKGSGVGLAAHFTFGGYVAHAVEVVARERDWRIGHCVCVADLGQVVNPGGVHAQLMGGTLDGISTAMGLQITVEDGRVQQSNYDGYPLLRMPDAPRIETHVLPSTAAPCGAGEMGVPGAAPALANAIFAATGRRLRDLPLRKFSVG
ncbi:MAG TPA: molybdopterin cofactor-binding domain-containing protein [Steroidobacteraceae bacterium]|nr:molybdopterin cofactor-binding domain-containing protein [Steroidobacteraceae bacterium]